MWAVKPVRKSVTLDPWGMYAAGKKYKKNEPRGERPVGCKAGRGVDDGGPVGVGAIKQEKGGQAETAGGLGSQRGVDNMRH